MNDTLSPESFPERFESIDELEHFLSTPTSGLVKDFANLDGDIMVLGVGGKVGPTLAMMAKRAAPGKRVIGVARFSDPDVRRRLEAAGVETISCDLLDQAAVRELPDVANIVFMAGKKFGTVGSEPWTWAMNAVVPTWVGDRFRGSRIVVFSTLCVYPFAEVADAGSTPDTPPTPLGEYANSCVARERVFQYFSNLHKSPGRIARLNYAIDCRYGVLMDVALNVKNGTPIDIRTGVANVIWQGDSTSHILRCLLQSELPSRPINIGAPKTTAIREVANRFGEIFGKAPIFSGIEQTTAWHNDCSEAQRLFGDPVVPLETMIKWNAAWLKSDLPLHHKPTHYDARDGAF